MKYAYRQKTPTGWEVVVTWAYNDVPKIIKCKDEAEAKKIEKRENK